MKILRPLRPEPAIACAPAGIEAFGRRVSLLAPEHAFSVEDARARLRRVYQPFLASRPMPREGVCVDVGAGFGAFAIPFALAFPGWRVWCFEPAAEAFSLLRANIETLGLANVVAVNAALSPRAPAVEAGALARAAARGRARGLEALAGPVAFRRDPRRPEAALAPVANPPEEAPEALELPALPPAAAAALGPALLKLCAPHEETGILEGLAETPIPYVVGASWICPPSRTLLHAPGRKDQVYLRRAGTDFALRRDDEPGAREDALDVVVATWNAGDYVLDCVRSILDGGAEDVRAIVVDDGSTDGCGERVREEFAGEPRVRVVRKPNGGCASARNYGRRVSNAAHIAFVDADDLVDPALFPGLLEIARWSGHEIVQGGFDLMEETDGETKLTPSYEAGLFDDLPETRVAGLSVRSVPPERLIPGQPTIWRRVYRRDFLDNQRLSFPEHIRAFDDQIFHMLTLSRCKAVLHADALRYRYRQHPGQDIRQGDERHFHSLEMFRLTVKRGLEEGWNGFNPIFRAYANTLAWSHRSLRPDLRAAFAEGAAELYAHFRRCLPAAEFEGVEPEDIAIPQFPDLVAMMDRRLRGRAPSWAWMHLDAVAFQPALLKMRAAMG